MGSMKCLVFAAFFCFASITASRAGEPVEIFNGKNLDGWKVDGAPLWTADDGVLTGRSNAKMQGSLLWTEKKFRDFVIEFEFRSQGKGDSGVFLRSLNEQIQIGTSKSLKRDMTGSPYIGSKRGYPAEAKDAPGLITWGKWTPMKIKAVAGRYQVWIHGKMVMDYNSDSAIEKGPVGLQVHQGVKMKIDFRRLKVEDLS